MAKWNEVTEAKVVYVRLDPKVKKLTTGETKETKGKSIRMGIKVTFGDGTWWFYHFKAGSWTQHTPGDLQYYRSGSPIIDMTTGEQKRGPERKYRFDNIDKVKKELAHCPIIPQRLEEGVDQALEDEAERAMAA